MCIVHHDEAHDGSAGSHQFSAFGEDGGYLAVFGSGETGVDEEGGDFIDSALRRFHQATGRGAVLALRSVHGHLILLVGGTFGGLGGFVHGFHLVTPLGGDDTVLIKRYNALVSSLGEGKVALRLVPELPGGGHNLAAGTGVYLLVLLLGHLLQGIHLAVFGFDGGAVDDDKRIACLHPVALLYEEGVHTSGQLSADTYFRCFHLSLQDQGLPAHE